MLANALIEIDPRFPRVNREARDALQVAKVELEGQAPAGAAPDPVADELAAKAERKKKSKKSKKRS